LNLLIEVFDLLLIHEYLAVAVREELIILLHSKNTVLSFCDAVPVLQLSRAQLFNLIFHFPKSSSLVEEPYALR